MTEGKYLSLWNKYLPAIRILLKKSVVEEQQLGLGKMELQFVDNRKNANYSFNLEIIKGKVENGIGSSAISKDLFATMNNDPVTRAFMNDKTISIKMSKASQLTIKSDLVVEPVV